MNALLVYPEFPDTFWRFRYALKFIGRKSAFPPLGLLTVAAMLPEEWEKRLIDLNIRRLRQEDLAWADCVFLSAMAVQRHSVRDVLAQCREDHRQLRSRADRRGGPEGMGGSVRGPVGIRGQECTPCYGHGLAQEQSTDKPQKRRFQP
jgi:hypothetical protein